MHLPNPLARSRGFSLVELAVVLVIATILLTMGISALSVQTENASFSVTKKHQDAIRDALSSYLGKYKRLPCPDLPDVAGNVAGQGDDNRKIAGDPTSVCLRDVGTVPYVDLGLPRDFALDGWDNFITYRVTTDANATLDWTRSANFAVGKPGKLIVSVRDPATNAATVPLTGPVTENAVVVLVSHGKNGLGAFTVQGTQNALPAGGTDELENADGSANFQFIQRERTETAVPTYGAFDDMVYFIKATDLITPLVKDGTVRTPEGETAKALSDTLDAIVGASLSTTTPTCPTTTLPVDGWGKTLLCSVLGTQIKQSTINPTTTVAIALTSCGPDMVCTNSDDVVKQVFVSQLQGMYVKAGIVLPP